MKYIYLGKIVNTHGIKGEIRLISDFDKKNLVFKQGFKVYIGSLKEEKVINSYRIHKNYDMITLEGLNDINEVLKYKGGSVYINKDDLNLKDNEFLLSDLIGLNIVSKGNTYGKVLEIRTNKVNTLLYVSYNKNYYIPYHKEFIKNVDLTSKEIEVERIEELL
ncbi:MAG: ribosome maturation factor RimM [Ruminococcus sp.]|nr:ribosome maturation factor RimM [Ruminococcus sp.]